MSFKSFVQDQLFVEFAQQAFDGGGTKKKTHSATKDEIIGVWKQIKPDTPIYITPMDDTYNAPGDHSTYGEDGVRITGSWPFIASVLGRLKDLLAFESPQTKLRLIFRNIHADSKATTQRQAYAFYINLERHKPEMPKVDMGT